MYRNTVIHPVNKRLKAETAKIQWIHKRVRVRGQKAYCDGHTDEAVILSAKLFW